MVRVDILVLFLILEELFSPLSMMFAMVLSYIALIVLRYVPSISHMGFPVAQMVKRLPAMRETQVPSLGQEDPSPGERYGKPLQYSCLKNSMDCHLRSLVGDSPWSHKESDTTERLHMFPQCPLLETFYHKFMLNFVEDFCVYIHH